MTYDDLLAEGRRLKEKNDCAVRAVALACSVSYGVAHTTLGMNGRKDGGRTEDHIIFRSIHQLGFTYRKFKVKSKTIRALEKELPAEGAFLVRVRGHILCIRDGVNHDWAQGRLHRIMVVHQIQPRVT
jgi:hypothetical protein